MSDFYVGQKVICVDDRNQNRMFLPVVKGQEYTIRFIYDTKFGVGVLLEELHNKIFNSSGQEIPYYAKRFMPKREKKTDISMFTEILKSVQIKEDA